MLARGFLDLANVLASLPHQIHLDRCIMDLVNAQINELHYCQDRCTKMVIRIYCGQAVLLMDAGKGLFTAFVMMISLSDREKRADHSLSVSPEI